MKFAIFYFWVSEPGIESVVTVPFLDSLTGGLTF